MRATHKARYVISVLAFGVLLVGPSLAVAQELLTYAVPLEGCPSQIRLTIPREFSQADTPAKLKQRTTILDALHANKARKARYSEIFLANWASENGLPYISVSSLGSLIRSQGRISVSDWREIRSEFLKSTAASRQSIIEKQITRYNAGSAVNANTIRGQIPTLFEEGDTAIVIVGSSTSVVGARTLEVVSVAKLAYVHKCIASVQIALDASAPNALKTLDRYMSQVIIK